MTIELLNCAAPAKLNLFLHVTGRRADGYHLLQSAFQLIDLSDSLDFKVREDGALHRCNEVAGVPVEQDLVMRAARLLQEVTGTQFGADITVHKVLPMGGGVGGGSSDAATTLIALNHLWRTGLNRGQLMRLGLQLGADVPFFIFGKNAFAGGVGEQLHHLDTPESWFVLIKPRVSIPTAEIFSSPDLTRNTPPVRITDFSSQAVSWKNDLQKVAINRYPEVAEAIQWLSQFGDARMTGSGACVFCAMPDKERALAAKHQVPEKWNAWITSSLREHPLNSLVVE